MCPRSPRDYLVEPDADEVLCRLRSETSVGGPLGNAEFVQKLEEEPHRHLTRRRRGRIVQRMPRMPGLVVPALPYRVTRSFWGHTLLWPCSAWDRRLEGFCVAGGGLDADAPAGYALEGTGGSGPRAGRARIAQEMQMKG